MQRFSFKLNILAGIISSLLAGQAFSSAVRDDVDYQYFRDFAENKGKFTVGAINVPIFNKNNEMLGIMFPDTPIPDFSSADRSGITTVISPQYIVSVAHNVGYNSVQFGYQGNNPDEHHYTYHIVDRNNYPDKLDNLNKDYHTPRVHKLITEVVPSESVKDGLDNNIYKDKNRFPYFARVGSGTQIVRDNTGRIQSMSEPYNYLTGGAPFNVTGGRYAWIDAGGTLNENVYGPLTTYGLPGDSGSPIWAFDKKENRWLLYGVLNFARGNDGNANTWSIIRKEWNEKMQEEDNLRLNNQGSIPLVWKKTGNASSVITNESSTNLSVTLYDANLPTPSGNNAHIPSLHHGKTVYFSGQSGTLQLAENIHQGAGALYFDTNFTVTGNSEDTTWQGAGISIAENKQIIWEIHNPENDRLSKIGKGTLYVSGRGANKGDISVGEGTVILAQQTNDRGEKQAFNQVGIVSGRSTVVLNDAQQVDPDKIYFGFRGGRLDLNGNDLTFKYIQNVDDGARIVNHNLTQSANVTITNPRFLTRAELTVKDRVHPNQHFYSWNRGDNDEKTNDYFLPKKSFPYPYYPTNQQSNDDWEYIGSDLEKAKDTALERLNKEKLVFAFNGYFGETDKTKNNGNLNLTFSPETNNYLFFVTGGLELNGDVNVTKGSLLLSGKPTPHAYDHLKGKDVIIDDDWINRSFNAANINVQDGNFYIGRNVTTAKANFNAKNQANLYLGFIPNKTPVCIRSDYSGKVLSCQAGVLAESVYQSLPATKISGNVHLADNSKLTLGKAELKGQISASQNTEVQLHKDAHWIMTNDSAIGHLTLNEGSQISLNNGGNNNTNTLTINGNLSGNGLFHFSTYTSNLIGNKILVKGTALGNYQFDVQDQGTEPDKSKRLTLLLQENGNLDNNLAVSLYNRSYVDLGTYRYQLMKEGQEVYLYSPIQAEYDAEIARIAEEKHKQQTQANVLSSSANTVVSEFSSQINALLHLNSHLDRKFVEKQNMEWYLWSKITNQKMSNSSNWHRLYQQNINLQQIGIEKQLPKNFALGVIYSQSQIRDRYDDNISGKRKIHQLSMYFKKYWTNDFFSSFDTNYAKSNNQITPNSQQNNINFNRYIWSMGANLGYNLNFANIQIQPYLGLRYYHLSSVDYEVNQLNAATNSNLLVYHAAISISKHFQYNNDLSIRPEFSSYYVDATHNSADIRSNDVQLESEFNKQLRHELNLNLQYQNINLAFGVGLEKGEQIDKQKLLNLQFGYKW